MNVERLSIEKAGHRKCQSELESAQEKYESQQSAINALTLKAQLLEASHRKLAQGVLSMAQSCEKLRATADREFQSVSST